MDGARGIFENAQAELERYRRLAAENLVSASDLNTRETTFRTARASLLSAQAATIQQEGEAIDLAQTSGAFIFASSADSELATLAAERYVGAAALAIAHVEQALEAAGQAAPAAPAQRAS